MTLSPTARVILGMVRFGNRTGYEIKVAVDRSIRFFWAASYGQIYPELKRLEEAGLLASTPAASGGRQRTAYELTPVGERALEEWILDDDDLTFELRSDGLLKLYFADLMPAEARLRHLRAMREHHEALVQTLRRIEPAARARAEQSGREFPMRVLEGGLRLHTLFAEWCTALEEELLAHEPAKASR